MSKLWKASGICERSLRKIGAFSINDEAADQEELAEALYWLDLSVAELVGTERCQWLTEQTLSISLLASTANYNVANSLGVDNPTDGISFPIAAWLRDSSGFDSPIEIIRRKQYEDIEDKDQTGTPSVIYIDRLNSNRGMLVHPVPNVTGFTVRILCQTNAPSMMAGTPFEGGNIAHGLAAEWQRYLINQNAADIGSGPVRRLPPGEVDGFRREAAISLAKLMTSSNTERVSQPRITRAVGV